MTIPSIENPVVQFHLRPFLTKRVALYTSSTEMRQRIVEKTIFKATSDPSILQDDPIDIALARLLHETAIVELRINKSMFQPGPIGHQLWQQGG
ncbi:hypothetical protein [Agrobacterium sp.]|uniref:hypothetical protein n=1 Tax=Agrobacterium sp. TaxID=361 RepID=UPI0028ABA0F0